jgi:Holliday junction resolvasome RuvABC endonuclease subunit
MNDTTHYIGLDVSLTCTGFAVLDHEGYIVETGNIKTQPASGIRDRMFRFNTIMRQIMVIPLDYPDCKVLIEGYSMGSRTYGGIDSKELGGIIRHALVTANIPVDEIPPKSLQKRVVGNAKATGKQKKEEMKAAVEAIYGELGLDTYDQYDAIGLALCCGGWK